MDAPLSAVPHWLQWVVVVAGVLAACATGVRAVPPLWNLLQRVVGLIDALTELPEFIAHNGPILHALNEQIVNDHGHVILRDQLDRVEKQNLDTIDRLSRVESGVAGLYKDQKALSDRFDDAEDTWRTRHGKENE